MKAEKLNSLLENVSAISAEFHGGNQDGFQKFYDTHKDHFSGFPGIWDYCVDLGRWFTRAEAVLKLNSSEGDYEWIEAIDAFASTALKSEPMDEKEAIEAAKTAIKGA